ncbi:MAG: 4Fe-4S binding protein [Flavobacteriaceae bacterium]|nr:4Fe-4S binding protein [Flavobacteriaceae bacterium]
MNKVLFFVKEEKTKMIATTIVAIIFLYFWCNGPLLHGVEILRLETIETKFSAPILVGGDGVDSRRIQPTFQTLKLKEEQSIGYGLLFLKKTFPKYYGLIATVANNPGLSPELGAKLLSHALKFSKPTEKATLLPASSMYYVSIVDTLTTTKRIYLESTNIVPNIRGYAGLINMGVFIGEKGNVQEVVHISSKETQSYLATIKRAGFYQQFESVRIQNGEQQLDAVSGATLSSEAMANTVSALVTLGIPYPISNYAPINEVHPFRIVAALNSIWILHCLVIFLMFVFAMQRRVKKTKKSVLIMNVLSVIYIGFFLNNSFTYISFLHPFVGTSVSSFVGLYSLFVLLGAIWGKNTYCKYVCPFGNVQRLILKVSPKSTRQKFFIPTAWVYKIRLSIAIVLITGVLLGFRNWSNFELFPDLFGWATLGVWFIVALATVGVTVVYPMIWCRLLCPTGAVLDGITDIMKFKGEKMKSFKKELK